MRRPLAHLLLALVVLAAALTAYGFWYVTVTGKSAMVAKLESQIVAKTNAAARVATARSALAEIAGDEAEVRSYFVAEADVVAFIDDLESRGSALGADVQVLSVSATPGLHPTLSLALTATGPFDSVMRTVGAIEYAPYDISMPTLAIGRNGKGWHADMTLTVGSVQAASSSQASPSATATKTATTSGLSPL